MASLLFRIVTLLSIFESPSPLPAHSAILPKVSSFLFSMEHKTLDMKVSCVNKQLRTFILALGIILFMFCVFVSCEPVSSKDTNDICDFYVSGPSEAGIINVRATFSARAGETIFLSPSGLHSMEGFAKSGLRLEFETRTNTEDSYTLSIESVGVLKAVTHKNSRLDIRYSVGFQKGASEKLPRSFMSPDFLLFTGKRYTIAMGSTLFLIPKRQDGTSLFRKFMITFSSLESDKDSFAPFIRKAKHKYFCTEAETLEDNFIAWGKIRVRNTEENGGWIRIAQPYDESSVAQPDGRILSFIEEIRVLSYHSRKVFGSNLRKSDICVLFLPKPGKRYRDSGNVLLGKNSIVIPFSFAKRDAEQLSSLGEAIFSIIAENSFMKNTASDAYWFFEGSVRLYGLITSVRAGLLTEGEAEELLSNIYTRYVSNPLSTKISLVNRRYPDVNGSFFSDKSTVVLASIASRLLSQTGAKVDLDTLILNLSKRFSANRDKSLSLVDIEESAENLTGKSWTRFLDRLVKRNSLIKFSQFSRSGIFSHSGNSSSARQKRLLTKGSGRGWLFLLVSVVMILLIPLIFGFYVRRAVKLDISMPAILPQEEEED